MASKEATNDQTTVGDWHHCAAKSVDGEQSKLRTVTWEEAQPWCNFVVLRPADLPSGLLVENLSTSDPLVLLKHFGPGNPDAAPLLKS